MRLTRALTRRGICRWLKLKGNNPTFCEFIYRYPLIQEVEIEKETGIVVAIYLVDGKRINCSNIARL